MTKRELIEKLKQNMPDFKGNEEEIEVKTALYIYIELGKIKSFDEKYYFGNSETRRKIYKLAEQESKSTEKMAKKKKLICVSLANLYCNILKEFGVNAITSEADEVDGHVYPIILTKNKKAIIADLQLDLENIQTKSKLEHFEYWGDKTKNRHESCNQQLLTEMLIEVGYIKSKDDYKNYDIDRLYEKVKRMNPHQTLNTILNSEEIYENNSNTEVIEANKYYRGVLRKTVPNYFGKKIFMFNCYRKKEDGEKDYTTCIFSEEDNVNPYLFSQKENRFLKTNLSKIKELQEEGLVLGVKKNELGSQKLQRYIEKIERQKDKNEGLSQE